MLMSDEREALTPYPRPSSQAPSRPDLRQILIALGAGLRTGTEGDLSSIFEQELRQLLAIRGVRLREVPARYQARLVTPTRTAGSIVLDVPTSDPRIQAVLEASTDPARTLDDGDLDLLDAAAQLGGLVLEAQPREAAVAAPASRRRRAADRVERGHGRRCVNASSASRPPISRC